MKYLFCLTVYKRNVTRYYFRSDTKNIISIATDDNMAKLCKEIGITPPDRMHMEIDFCCEIEKTPTI